VFAKCSTLIAVQLPPVPSEDRPTHVTIYGVHSRSVSGLTCLHGNQFISCSLDGSVAKFALTESHESHVTSTGSCESHVTPTSVEIGMVCGERQMQGLAVSEHGLFAAFLTSEGGTSVSSKHKNTSHLHFSPLLPLSHLHPNTGISLLTNTLLIATSLSHFVMGLLGSHKTAPCFQATVA
jgi:hypothetical protein